MTVISLTSAKRSLVVLSFNAMLLASLLFCTIEAKEPRRLEGGNFLEDGDRKTTQLSRNTIAEKQLQCPSGAQGSTGATGNTGATGLIGDQGSTGVIGVTGAEGATGMTGPDGSFGSQGAIGAQGLNGEVGPIGAVGGTGTSSLGNFMIVFKSTEFSQKLDLNQLFSYLIEFDSYGQISSNWSTLNPPPPTTTFTIPQSGVYFVSYSIELESVETQGVQYTIQLIQNPLTTPTPIPGTDISPSEAGDLLVSNQSYNSTTLATLAEGDTIGLQVSAKYNAPASASLTIPEPKVSYSPFTSVYLTIVLVNPQD